jgi:hypothetical protein
MKLAKAHVNIVLIIFVSILYIYVAFFSKSYLESCLGRESGFYSMLFFTFNHALYAESTHLNFRINTDDWIFKFKDGWSDYFEPYEINNHIQIFNIYKRCPNVLEDYSIAEYKKIIPLIYKYNQTTIDYIRDVKSQLNLIDGAYDSLFVQRGDKISDESEYNGPEKYIDSLVLRNPYTKVVYVHTDDYQVIEEIQAHISKKQMTVEIKTLCEKSNTVFISNYKERDNNESDKIVEDMSVSEMYKNTLTMIAGVDLACKSNICVLDYESNIGRFIKLFHNNSSNVYNLLDPNNDINYKNIVCPAFSF